MDVESGILESAILTSSRSVLIQIKSASSATRLDNCIAFPQFCSTRGTLRVAEGRMLLVWISSIVWRKIDVGFGRGLSTTVSSPTKTGNQNKQAARIAAPGFQRRWLLQS